MKKRALTLIRILISLSLIGVIFWTMKGTSGEVIGIIKNINIGLFAIGFLTAVSAPAILGYRLQYLLKAQGIPIKMSEAVSLSFIGFFFNNFLPTSVGGDIAKAYYASKKTKDKIGCFTTVFMDRLFGVSSLILLASGSAILTHLYAANRAITWPIFVITGFMAAFFFLLWNRSFARFALSPVLAVIRMPAIGRMGLEEKLKKAYSVISSFKDKKGVAFRAVIISFVAQVISFSAAYFWLMGMGRPVSIGVIMMALPIVIIISMLPSINGLGVREGAIVFLLSPHAGKEAAFALGILWLFILLVLSIIGGLTYLLGKQYRLKSLKGGLINDRQTAS